MTDLAEWLLEQIADDEAEARKWVHHAQQNDLIVRDPQYLGMFMPGWHQWRDIEAFAARVLAECTAKRRIVELHHVTAVYDWRPRGLCAECSWDGDEEARPVDFPCPTLRLLAQPYRDRSGYRSEWDVR